MSEPSASDAIGQALAQLAGSEPEPMPPAVAARLHARLAAEQQAGSPAPPRYRRPAVLAAAAAVVIAVIGGTALALRPAGQAVHSSASAASRASSATGGAAGAAGATATGRPGPVLSPPVTTRFLATGRRYTPTTLASAVQLAADHTVPGPQAASGAGAPSASARQNLAALPGSFSVGPALAGCLTALAVDPGERPLLVDQAYFRGQPALIVVEPGSPGRWDIYAVSPSCSAAGPHVRYFESVPRRG